MTVSKAASAAQKQRQKRREAVRHDTAGRAAAEAATAEAVTAGTAVAAPSTASGRLQAAISGAPEPSRYGACGVVMPVGMVEGDAETADAARALRQPGKWQQPHLGVPA